MEVSSLGNVELLELLCVTASFVRRSAASFPSMFIWAGTHLIWMVSLGIFLCMFVMAWWNTSIM